jgi:hypothetical protein
VGVKPTTESAIVIANIRKTEELFFLNIVNIKNLPQEFLREEVWAKRKINFS